MALLTGTAITGVLLKAIFGAVASAGATWGISELSKIDWKEIEKKIDLKFDPKDEWENPFKKRDTEAAESETDKTSAWDIIKKIFGNQFLNGYGVKGGIANIDETANQSQTSTNPEQQPNENKDDEEEKKGNTFAPTISDETNTNIELPNLNSFLNEYENRQSQILEEAKEWENTRYQRTVDDMKKAGINPNLVGNIDVGNNNPYDQVSAMNADELVEFISANVSLLEQEIQNGFDGKVTIWENVARIVSNIGIGILASFIGRNKTIISKKG